MESSGLARAVDRLVRHHHPECDSRTLRSDLLGAIRRCIPFDAYAWLLTDPETEVGCDPLADVPCLPELPRLIRLEYLTTTNRWTGLAASACRLGDRRGESLVWRELLADYRVTDIASVVFRDGHGCWGFLDLWRLHGAGDFTEGEVADLASVATPVTSALRTCQARTFSRPGPAVRPAGPVVLVLSPELEVRGQTAETENLLRALVPPGGDRGAIPAGAYNVAAQLLALEAGVDAHPAVARAHLTDGTRVTFRAARIGAHGDHERDIAVTIDVTPPAERLAVFARAHALTERETELLGHVAAGLDTRGIAERMFVSENTVQDHLKSMFDKTQARTRRALVAQATGH